MMETLDKRRTIILLAIVFLISTDVSFGSKSFVLKLKVTWYYETLCPGCRSWFKQAIKPNYDQFLENVNFELIPYGNAKTEIENGKINITCQHGDKECLGNMYQACALKLVDDEARKLKYCMCVMTSDAEDVYKKCAEDNEIRIDFRTLDECARGSNGLKYLAALGDKQKKLKLPYVPLLTIDGKRVTKEEENDAWTHFGQFLCKRLRGKKPKFCNAQTRNATASPQVALSHL